MATEVNAIQTRYKGYRFRSRLEARWAVFFDVLGIKWLYEHQGVRVPCISDDREWCWLPDFYLPETQTHVEVKGEWEREDVDYFDMILNAMDWNGPFADGVQSTLLLGNIPDGSGMYTPTFPLLRWAKGVGLYAGFFQGLGDAIGNWPLTKDDFDSWGQDGGRLKTKVVNAIDDPLEWCPQVSRHFLCGDKFNKAVITARSARFEHGETPN